MLTNQKLDAVDWARKTMERVDRKRWPSAMVLIYETSETVVERVGFNEVPAL